jgi:hypothetical protein
MFCGVRLDQSRSAFLPSASASALRRAESDDSPPSGPAARLLQGQRRRKAGARGQVPVERCSEGREGPDKVGHLLRLELRGDA